MLTTLRFSGLRKTSEAEFKVFSSELAMKRVAKTIMLMNAVAKINDPQCELLLLRAYTGISELYFAMRTCPPVSLSRLNVPLTWLFILSWSVLSLLLGWGLATVNGDSLTYPFHLGVLAFIQHVIFLNYAFLVSRIQSAALQTKLLRHAGIVASGSTFDEALSTFNTSTEIDFLIFQTALWYSQMEDHTFDWLWAVPNLSLLQGLYGGYLWDHVVSCAGIGGIKHWHNVVRNTLVEICYRSEISSSKEVDIGLDEGKDKSLRLADVLLYSWDVGRDVLTEAAQCKRVKYEATCADIRYGFLPFPFSSFGELEKDPVTLVKRIQKFSMAQDIGARTTVHIFNRIDFSIAKGHVGIVASGSTFDDALSVFNTSIEIDFLTCSRVFVGDIYGDNAVSCARIIGIKHLHNVEVNIGLAWGCDKPLRPTNMLLYLLDWGLDVCVDLTVSSPLTQSGMTAFVPGHSVIDATQRKRVKYEAKCAAIGHAFLLFSFSCLGEFNEDAVTLLKRIRKFFMAEDIGAHATVYVFNGICFTIAKGIGVQIVSRLLTNYFVVVPPGSVVVPTGSVVVPPGSVVVPTGSVVVPPGSVVVTTGSVVVIF
ncbi:hypothetical protein Tco_0052788 [Tanacetum coccineum]